MTEITENNDLPEQLSHERDKELVLPGKHLRAAREAMGLTREAVAAQLRLQVRLIAALEDDNYDALPSQAFVSGYLRSYARLLGLPEDSFVPPQTSIGEPPPLVAKFTTEKQASSHDKRTRLVTYLVISAIAVSVVMWWLAQRQAVEPEFMTSEPAIVEQEEGPDLKLPETELQGADGLSATPESVPVPESALPPEQMPITEQMPQDGSEAQEPQTGAKDAVVSQQSEPVQQTVEQRGEAETTAPAPPLTEAMPQSKLELRYEADSWTEVNDNAGRQLAYGLIRAGNVLELRGEAPFRVFLGYAPGVTVYYNGELFDHSPFQRRDVARFRIGRAEHNHPGSR